MIRRPPRSTLFSLHDALPIFKKGLRNEVQVVITVLALEPDTPYDVLAINAASMSTQLDRKSTRLNSSHMSISYAVFCLKKKKKNIYIYYPLVIHTYILIQVVI